MHRRLALLGLGTLAAGPPALGAARPPRSRPRVAAQLYVWIQHFQAQGQALDENLDEALAVTAAAGFEAVQGWLSWFGGEARATEIAALLGKNRLAMRAAYGGGKLHEPAAAAATIAAIAAQARAAKAAGLETVVMNPDPIGREKTGAELATQAAALGRLGAALRGEGVRLAVHAHDQEMKSGAREWRHILANTRPGDVSICLDLHWAFRGGQDPLALLDASAPRLVDLHLRNSKGGVWLEELAAGDVDYAKVAARLRRLTYAGTYTVELAYEDGTARTRSLAENLKRSRAFVRTIFGV
jgi:inosose dehydratase